MHPIRKKRLFFVLIGMVLLGLGVGSVLFALRDNLNLFYTPTEVVQGKVTGDRPIRVGGLVEPGSVDRGEGVKVEFAITDLVNVTRVRFEGILPDLFQENEGVVVLGKIGTDGVLVATEVFARHDENYMPPEAMEAIKRAAEASKLQG